MKFDEKDLLSQIYNKDPYSAGEYGEYYCANCEKYVKVLDKDIKTKQATYLSNVYISPEGDIFGLGKSVMLHILHVKNVEKKI